tara:strand:+ start:610 stop:849 length:240 start_codon:yes stop_codon:yes gene_type:complete
VKISTLGADIADETIDFTDALECVINTLERGLEMNLQAGAPSVIIDTLADACNHAYAINKLLNDDTDIIVGLDDMEESE